MTGTLLAEGRRLAVHGQGWFDHQWGNFPTDQNSLRWNWFACQLGDGRSLMLYEFLTANDAPSGIRGTLVLRDGRASHLHDSRLPLVVQLCVPPAPEPPIPRRGP